MWDAYKGVSTSTGNSYPEITTLLKQQQQAGALIMDYAGHGRADQISHERVLTLSDFEKFSNTNLPLGSPPRATSCLSTAWCPPSERLP